MVVLRDRKPVHLDISEVVVGDVLTLKTGDIIGVDGLYMNGEDMVCDESMQTGESCPVAKGNDKVCPAA